VSKRFWPGKKNLTKKFKPNKARAGENSPAGLYLIFGCGRIRLVIETTEE